MLPAVIVCEIDLVLHLKTEFRQCEEREEGRHEHGHIEVRIVAEMEGSEVEGKQALDEHPRQIDALDAEEATGQHDDKESEEYTRNSPQSFVELLQKQLIGTDENALQGTVGIKHNGEEQERIVSEFLRRDEIGYQEDRQKKEKEYVTTEYHED